MDPVNDYYGMEMWKRMLGMQAPYGQPPQMQYAGMGGQQQGQQKQSSNPMSTYNNVMKMMSGGSTATGMTPNATNAMGESYYGWGAQTGDWGATGSTGSGLIAGNEIAAPGAFAEIGSAADIGSLGGAGTEGGLISGAGPYAALAAGLYGIKLDNDWNSKGSGKSLWGEFQSVFDESVGNNGFLGMLKGIFS